MVGIYKITSPSGKIYVGQSIDIDRRVSYYRRLKCAGQSKLYASLKKYGWDSHKFEIICECRKEELNDLEVSYIGFYNSFNSAIGLNLQSGGAIRLHTTETKLKISTANRGRILSAETRRKLSNAWNGRIVSEMAKVNMRKSHIGRVVSQDTKDKIRAGVINSYANGIRRMNISGDKNPFFGKNHSAETKDKISKSSIGNKNCVGRILSEETKRKISESQKTRLMKKIGYGLEVGMYGRGEFNNGLYQ